jgi:hypothetical protein
MMESICAPACPDCTRRSHAACEVPNDANAAGIVRVPGLPSWWHDRHPPDFTTRTHSA